MPKLFHEIKENIIVGCVPDTFNYTNFIIDEQWELICCTIVTEQLICVFKTLYNNIVFYDPNYNLSSILLFDENKYTVKSLGILIVDCNDTEYVDNNMSLLTIINQTINEEKYKIREMIFMRKSSIEKIKSKKI